MSEEFLACWSRGNWGESTKLTKSEVVGQAGRGGGGGACSQIAEMLSFRSKGNSCYPDHMRVCGV